MSWAANLNFIANEDREKLNDIQEFLKQQETILKALHKALELLRKAISRNQRHHRVKPTADFVYTTPENDEQKRRQDALKELDHISRSLCIFALTKRKICNLTNASFDALISGIPKFIQAEPGRHDLIKSTIHDYIQYASSDPTDYKFKIIDGKSKDGKRPRKRPRTSAGKENPTARFELGGCGSASKPQSSAFQPDNPFRNETARMTCETGPWPTATSSIHAEVLTEADPALQSDLSVPTTECHCDSQPFVSTDTDSRLAKESWPDDGNYRVDLDAPLYSEETFSGYCGIDLDDIFDNVDFDNMDQSQQLFEDHQQEDRISFIDIHPGRLDNSMSFSRLQRGPIDG
ncbi:Fc.00g081600.m01.CDS01 [Cosmosporella sp. VM-42]